MIKSTIKAAHKSGMPISHAICFHRVADSTNCVIACRSVGIYATGLILENYASKGFHVKTKSCNWGPMAGFVLSDPRFSKKGMAGIESQSKATAKALKDGATETPIYITEKRRKELEKMGCMTQKGGNMHRRIYTANPIGNTSNVMQFVLERKMSGVPGARGLQMWSVCYNSGETVIKANGEKMGVEKELQPVMSLVNPGCSTDLRGTYRSATTGDYDLWGVWPRAKKITTNRKGDLIKPYPKNEFIKPKKPGEKPQFKTYKQNHPSVKPHQSKNSLPTYDPRGLDKRKVPGSSHRPLSYKTFEKHESPDLGNITGRIIKVKDRLNSAIQRTGYSGGLMVHHSDEVGRPQVFEVEMDFIAFIPGQSEARFVANMGDLGKLMRECIEEYSISINGAWGQQLGFKATKGGHYITPEFESFL